MDVVKALNDDERLAFRGNCPVCINPEGLLAEVDSEEVAEVEVEEEDGRWWFDEAMVAAAACAAAETEAGRWPEERLGLEVRENPGRSC